MNEDFRKRYFCWLLNKISYSPDEPNGTYNELLWLLYETEFVWTIEMDENRSLDGIELRFEFSKEHFEDIPCSVLEMMIALAYRCERHIMTNDIYGDRTGTWFWSMIESLGLIEMEDRSFDYSKAMEIIDRFLSRDYERNGRGGLITLPYDELQGRDMRKTEIWYQMMWYLASVYKHERGLR